MKTVGRGAAACLGISIAVTSMPVTGFAASEEPKKQKAQGTTAGVVRAINQTTHSAVSQPLQVSQNAVVTVSAVENNPWLTKLMPAQNAAVDVHEACDDASARVGGLGADAVADITAKSGDWYRISSGNLTGFVRADQVVTGNGARDKANSSYGPTATCNTNGLRVREYGSLDARIVGVMNFGDTLPADRNAAYIEGWTPVKAYGRTCYVSSQYVAVTTDYHTGMTVQEEQAAAEAAARKAAEEAAKEAARQKALAEQARQRQQAACRSVTNPAVSGTQVTSQGLDSRTMMAAIIFLEAGTNYDGDLAVGSVIMNRVHSSLYPNSIEGVISQPHQFVTYSRMRAAVNRGIPAVCYQAADQVLAGVTNTRAMNFRQAGTTRHAGVNIGGNVFF